MEYPRILWVARSHSFSSSRSTFLFVSMKSANSWDFRCPLPSPISLLGEKASLKELFPFAVLNAGFNASFSMGDEAAASNLTDAMPVILKANDLMAAVCTLYSTGQSKGNGNVKP